MAAPLCPKCGEPVRRVASAHGVARYRHPRHPSTRKKLGLCTWHGTQPVGVEADKAKGIDTKTAKALARKMRAAGRKRLVITAAQNATPVNKAFLASLLGYCKHRGAQLIVIPYRYKNPTSMWSEAADSDDWWASELAPYITDQRVDLNDNIVLLADIKTQPTATAPLQGFETVTGAKSAIIGHPKLALKTVPTPQSKMAKILTSTGAVTKKNYIESKAGKKAEHHHTFGACVIELDGKRFHMRQINAVQDGSFCDLQFEYAGDKVRQQSIAALVMGDTHHWFLDPAVAKATFEGPNSIIGALKPKSVVWHDAIDGYARNHHHKGEVFINFVKHHAGRGNVERELDDFFAFVDRVTPPGVENVFVPSNHQDVIAKWVKETDPRTDPENCVFWAETFRVMCEAASWGRTGARTIDPFAYWGQKKLKTAKQARFPSRGESVLIKGIDCSHHGDRGPNGGPGALKAFSRIGVKSVTAHRHAPGIEEGAYGVGHSCYGDLEYTGGSPSSWLPTHCLIYENGKRSLITCIDGEWQA